MAALYLKLNDSNPLRPVCVFFDSCGGRCAQSHFSVGMSVSESCTATPLVIPSSEVVRVQYPCREAPNLVARLGGAHALLGAVVERDVGNHPLRFQLADAVGGPTLAATRDTVRARLLLRVRRHRRRRAPDGSRLPRQVDAQVVGWVVGARDVCNLSLPRNMLCVACFFWKAGWRLER